MATQSLTRSLLSKPKTLTFLVLARPFSSVTTTTTSSSSAIARSPLSLLCRLRPLSAAVPAVNLHRPPARNLSTNATSSSLSDPNPNWSNRPPKETILLDGCDFEHWLVVVEKPQGDPTRDEIIDSYIKILAQIVGSEEEARMKIYSVSTRCYYAFGCIVPEELSYKIKELPGVRWVLPDSYLDVKNKDYGGEPFIDGQAVPYHPKYHEEWIRNNARAMERNKRNDRPRSFDRSRNFERRRENMQNSDFQNSPNQGMQNRGDFQNSPNQGMQNRGDFQNSPNQGMQNRGDFKNSPNQGMQDQGQNPPMSNQPTYNRDFQNQAMNSQNFRNPQMNNRDFQGPPRPNQPVQNQNFQGPPRPNQPMHNQNFQNPPMPNQPMHNQNFQNPPMPNQPIQNRGVQNSPPTPHNGGAAYYTGGQQNYYEAMPPNNMEWAPPSNAGAPPPNRDADWPGNALNRDAEHPQNYRNREY